MDGPRYMTWTKGGAFVPNYGAPDRNTSEADRRALEAEYRIVGRYDEYGNMTGDPMLLERQALDQLRFHHHK